MMIVYSSSALWLQALFVLAASQNGGQLALSSSSLCSIGRRSSLRLRHPAVAHEARCSAWVISARKIGTLQWHTKLAFSVWVISVPEDGCSDSCCPEDQLCEEGVWFYIIDNKTTRKKGAWLYIFEDKIKHQTSQHKIKKETSKHRVRDAHEIGSDCFVVYDVR